MPASKRSLCLEQGNWDGAWNEVPRYHNWTMMLFSTLFDALQRRTNVDFYQDPNTKALTGLVCPVLLAAGPFSRDHQIQSPGRTHSSGLG